MAKHANAEAPAMPAPTVGMIVRLVADDWNRHLYQMTPKEVDEQVDLARATIYGEIVKLDDRMIVLAYQTFSTGSFREVLAIPLGCVVSVEEVTGWGELLKPTKEARE